MVKFFRTWKKTTVGIAMLTTLALPGCATLDAAYSILEASNPVFFILSKFFFRPVFASLQGSMEEYGDEILAKLPPGLRKTVNTVREVTRKVEAIKAEITEMKALRALVKKQVEQNRDSILKKTGIVKELNAAPEKTRKGFQAELTKANQELTAAKTKAEEQEKQLRNRDQEIARLNAKLSENEKQLGASRNSMQKQMLAMEAENEGLRKQHEEMLKRINTSEGVAKSPMVFMPGAKWDETKETVQKVRFNEKEFQRVAWPDQITNQFQDWNPDIKPIEIEMQQNVLYTAMVMKESPEEYQKLEKEIEKKVEEEADNYNFNVVRKK